jgi:hypothetical protein
MDWNTVVRFRVMKMEAARSSETLVSNYHTIRRNESVNHEFYLQRVGNLKSHIMNCGIFFPFQHHISQPAVVGYTEFDMMCLLHYKNTLNVIRNIFVKRKNVIFINLLSPLKIVRNGHSMFQQNFYSGRSPSHNQCTR